MEFLRSVKGCTTMNKIRKEEIRKKLEIFNRKEKCTKSDGSEVLRQ